MCEPYSMAALAGLSVYSQHQAAGAQADAMNARSESARAAADVSLGDKLTQLSRQQEQARIEAGAADVDDSMKAQAARATAQVAAGEAGVSGNSVDLLMAQFDTQEAVRRDRNLARFQAGNDRRQQAAQGFITDRERIYAGLAPAPEQSTAAQLLDYATAGLNTYSMIDARTRRASGVP